MKIVIIGAGKIGSSIISHVSHEAHEVVVIDNQSLVVEKMVNQYDVMGICGNGLNIDILENAGVESSDLVIAVTESDEGNMLICQLAKKLGAKSAIARVRAYDYVKHFNVMRETLGISKFINPERETAKEIIRMLSFPEAIKAETFAGGKVDLVELNVPESSPLVGLPLYQVGQKLNVTNFLVCAVTRNNEVTIPNGQFVLQAKDRIHVTSDRTISKDFVSKLGLSETKMKNIIIIGGGKIAVYLAQTLLENKMKVKIIEKDMAKCVELSQLLPNADIICGNGSDQVLLEEEGLKHSDALVCLTGIDEENIIISMYASKQNVKKVVCKINKTTFVNLLESIDMASAVSPADITASQIVSYIRAASNPRGSNVKTLYKLVNNEIEALEFEASNTSNVINIPLKDLKTKKNVLVAGIVRGGEVIMPNGNTVILEKDSVIVVAQSKTTLNDLDDILV